MMKKQKTKELARFLTHVNITHTHAREICLRESWRHIQ